MKDKITLLQINNIHDATKFLRYCVDYLKDNFIPGAPFSNYKDTLGDNIFTLQEQQICNEQLNKCIKYFDIESNYCIVTYIDYLRSRKLLSTKEYCKEIGEDIDNFSSEILYQYMGQYWIEIHIYNNTVKYYTVVDGPSYESTNIHTIEFELFAHLWECGIFENYDEKQLSESTLKTIEKHVEEISDNMLHLSAIWTDETDNLLTGLYPFSSSLDDLVNDVLYWKSNVLKNIKKYKDDSSLN